MIALQSNHSKPQRKLPDLKTASINKPVLQLTVANAELLWRMPGDLFAKVQKYKALIYTALVSTKFLIRADISSALFMIIK